jgi:hypothetical protein
LKWEKIFLFSLEKKLEIIHRKIRSSKTSQNTFIYLLF